MFQIYFFKKPVRIDFDRAISGELANDLKNVFARPPDSEFDLDNAPTEASPGIVRRLFDRFRQFIIQMKFSRP